MTKNLKFIEEENIEMPSYEESPFLNGVICKEDYEFLNYMNKGTISAYKQEWEENIVYNLKFWKKHKPLRQAAGLCKNKGVIGVGAGQSFNQNKEVLRYYLNRDGVRGWEDRDFVTISSNHQFKPLLNMGIIPDFVMTVDASDVVLDQLTKDIPKSAKNVTLITGVHCSPKVIETWTKQKRPILFYGPTDKGLMETFHHYYKVNPYYHRIELGGNVLNGSWIIGTGVMDSTVFFAVGNDLSFPKKETIEEQRISYYADGDYSSNAKGTGTGRDEANTNREWAGFSLSRSNILSSKGLGRYDIKLDIVGTTVTLWVYKIWLEMQVMRHTQEPVRFNYYNCSESGILGVMAKSYKDKDLRNKDNWYLLDEVAVNKHTGATMYHTAMLSDALEFFTRVKESMKCHRYDVQNVIDLGARRTTDIAGLVLR